MTTTLDGTVELSNKSDTQLWRMLAGAEAYEASFIAAAQVELRRRRPASCEAARMPVAVPVETPLTVAPASQPLNWPFRLFVFVTSISLLGTLLAAHYEDQGQTRKSEECWMALIFGLVCWCLAILLSKVL